MENILKVENLSVKFDTHNVFGNLNFEILRDSVVSVTGPNGVGKTVLFKCLLGLIQYQGKVIWAPDVKIGYVPQKLSVSLDIPITVLDFLKLKENDNRKINEILTKVGFKEKAQHAHNDIRVLFTRIGGLSGGELQRILMAYALLGNPNVLLLDEPTAGVDVEGEEVFYDLFTHLKKDVDLTIIFISHDMSVVKRYSDKTIELKHIHHER